MAKSKKKADDFKKVKLKVGKKLKKPTETDTTFKSGKVVLLEQLKRGAESETIPLTKRKLALTDLLHHLRHYNANFRKDGIIGLKELLTENPHLVRSNLSTLIEYLGPLFTDSESDILKTSVAVWEIILTNVDSSNLSPYFSLLAAHLSCAMSHLNVAVKKFSLKILNLLLSSHSDLLRRSTSFDLILFFLNSLPHAQSNVVTAPRSLMARSNKHELLKVVKNILAIFDVDGNTASRSSNGSSAPAVIDCTESSSGIVSLSLSAAECSPQQTFEFDDYVRPLGTVPNEIGRYSKFISSVVPFCHALWIEVTSAEDQNSVDCFTFDLGSLIIMNDVLFVYHSLLRRPADLFLSTNSENTDSEFDAFKTSLQKMFAKGFLDRYHNLLPVRRGARRSGEDALLSGYNLNGDICSSVNFGLCRFLAYASVMMGTNFTYPLESIEEFLWTALSGEKKRLDSQTLRGGMELVRDLRHLIESNGTTTETPQLQLHYWRLGRMIMDCLLMQSGRSRIKMDIISWICQDLENLVDIQQWPKFEDFIERLPSIVSSLLDDPKKAATTTDSTSIYDVLYRLTRILLLRINALPVDREIAEKTIKGDLLSLLLSNIDQFPPSSKKDVLNLLYYAVPLPEKVVNSVITLRQNREGPESENLKRLLS